MQKTKYYKNKLTNLFKTKKNPVVVYGGTFIIFLIISVGGLVLATGLFTQPEDSLPITIVHFENTEGNRVVQTGSIRLNIIDEETTRIESTITQFSFATSQASELVGATFSYSLFGAEGLSEPVDFEGNLVVEDSFVINESVESLLDTFQLEINVTYIDNTNTQKQKTFFLTNDDIYSIRRIQASQSYWIWD